MVPVGRCELEKRLTRTFPGGMVGEHVRVLAKPKSMTDEECGSLPVFGVDGQCVSCWRMSWRERLSALVFGRMWIAVLSGQSQPPIAPMVTRDERFWRGQ